MSVPLLQDEVDDPARGASPRAGASPTRFAVAWQRLQPRAYDALVLVGITLFHHVLGVKYRFAQIAYDERFFLNEGWSVLMGQIPYRDFQEFKPPVIFFVHALGIQLFGLEGLGYRKFLALLSLSGFLVLALALLSRRDHRLLAAAVLMLMVNHFYDKGLHHAVINNAETLALDFFVLGTGVLLARTKWERTQLVLGGVLLSLSPLSKEPMAFATAAAWLTLLILRGIEAGSWQAARRFALYTIVGVAGVAASWLAYMLVTDSLSWYVLQLKLNFAYTENYAYQLRWASRNPEGGKLAEMFRRLHRGYANSAHLAVFIPFFVALLAWPGRRRLVSAGALLTFAAALYGVSIGGGFADRYFIMGLTGTFFGVALGVIALDELTKRWRDSVAHGLGVLSMGVALFLTWPRFAQEWKRYGSYAAPAPPVSQEDIAFVHQHTSPGDKIWTTDDPLLYPFSGRESAFRGGIVLDEIIEYYPGKSDKERLAPIRQGLEEKRPKVVVLGDTRVRARRKRRYMRALVMPFLRDNGYIKLSARYYLRPD
jgi:hypothetical protein